LRREYNARASCGSFVVLKNEAHLWKPFLKVYGEAPTAVKVEKRI